MAAEQSQPNQLTTPNMSPEAASTRLCHESTEIGNALDAMVKFHGSQALMHTYMELLSLLARGTWALVEVVMISLVLLNSADKS